MLGTSLGMRMKNMKSKAFCTLKHCLCVRLGCMAIFKKKLFLNSSAFGLQNRRGFAFFVFLAGEGKRAAGERRRHIGMRVGGIFLSIQPRACLALSARLALSSAQQKKKRNRILKKNVFETVPLLIGNISA